MKKYTKVFALLSLFGLFLFTIIILFEHFFRTELPPMSHYLSEYSLGQFGWIHIMAFSILSISQLYLFIGLLTQLKASILSIVTFAIYCIGILLVTLFPADASGALTTTTGFIHGLSALVASASFCISMFAWGFDFKKKDSWAKLAKPSFWLGTISCTIFIVGYFNFTPLPGLVQRMLVVCNFSWLILISKQLYKVGDKA